MPDLLITPATEGNVHILFETGREEDQKEMTTISVFLRIHPICGSGECAMCSSTGCLCLAPSLRSGFGGGGICFCCPMQRAH